MSARVCRHGDPDADCLDVACRIQYLATELHNTKESRALYVAEVERLCGQVDDRIAAVLALHYPAYNDGDRTPLCPECKGAEGTHPCDCWAPEGGTQVVCGHCHTGGYRSSSVPYPCPTVCALGVDDDQPGGEVR